MLTTPLRAGLLALLAAAGCHAVDPRTRSSLLEPRTPAVSLFALVVRAAPTGPHFAGERPPLLARPTTGVLRIVNDARYPLIDVRLNHAQRVPFCASLESGSSTDFAVRAGRVDYSWGVGFWSGMNREVWFGSAGSTKVEAGQTVTVRVANPVLPQLLTDFSTGANWDGEFLDARGELHTRRFHFRANGAFFQLTDGEVDRLGVAQLVSWPDNATTVRFRLCTPNCGPELELKHPFTTFTAHDGPPSWPLIDYFRQ